MSTSAAGAGTCERAIAESERVLRDRCGQEAYYDFILAQGMLPPDFLKVAVMNEFVPSQRD